MDQELEQLRIMREQVDADRAQLEQDKQTLMQQGGQEALGQLEGQAPVPPWEAGQVERLESGIKTYSDRLAERRQAMEMSTQRAGEAFRGAVESDVPLWPGEIFSRFQTFERAGREFIQPAEQEVQWREELLAGIKQRQYDREFEMYKMQLDQQALGLGADVTPDNVLQKAGALLKTGADRKKFEEALAALKQLNALEQSLGAKNPSNYRLLNYLDPTTGKLANLFGGWIGSYDDREFRASLNQYFSDERKRLFGTVLTKGEEKAAFETIANTRVQESDNLMRIASSKEQWSNELESLFSQLQTPQGDINYIVSAAMAEPFYNAALDRPGGIIPEATATGEPPTGELEQDPYDEEVNRIMEGYGR